MSGEVCYVLAGRGLPSVMPFTCANHNRSFGFYLEETNLLPLLDIQSHQVPIVAIFRLFSLFFCTIVVLICQLHLITVANLFFPFCREAFVILVMICIDRLCLSTIGLENTGNKPELPSVSPLFPLFLHQINRSLTVYG